MKACLMCLPLLLGAAPAAAQVVTGTVEGIYGVAVRDASVTVANEEGVVIAHRFTDLGGRFTVHVPVAGVYRVRVLADDFQPASRTVRVGENGSVSTRLLLQGRNASFSSSGLQDPMSANRTSKEPMGRARGGGGGHGAGSESGGKPGREN